MCSGISSLGQRHQPEREQREVPDDRHRLRRWYAAARARIHCDADTAIVWFRRDLRVHDHPALTAAARAADRVVPVFVLDDALLHGRFPSGPRGALPARLPARAARGAARARRRPRRAPRAARARAGRAGAARSARTRCTSPPTSRRYAMARDRARGAAMRDAGVEVVRHPGCSSPTSASRAPGRQAVHRLLAVLRARGSSSSGARCTARRATLAAAGAACEVGAIPSLEALGLEDDVADPFRAGRAGRRASACTPGCATGSATTRSRTTASRAARPSSRPTCTSAASRRASCEERARDAGAGEGPARVRAPAVLARLLRARAARPTPATRATPTAARWTRSSGRTTTRRSRPGARAAPASRSSTPAMRQLRARGWMHNRARLIVGSFLTKDLHIDWRRGEAHFMRSCSTATRPTTTATGSGSPRSASTRRRTSAGCTTRPLQQERHDPDGAYVRRWVPELRDVPPSGSPSRGR